MRRENNQMMGKPIWNTCTWYCPNCGNKCTGSQNGKGILRIDFNKCGVQMKRIVMSRRHDRIDIFAPEGEEHPEGLIRHEKLDIFYPESESDS